MAKCKTAFVIILSVSLIATVLGQGFRNNDQNDNGFVRSDMSSGGRRNQDGFGGDRSVNRYENNQNGFRGNQDDSSNQGLGVADRNRNGFEENQVFSSGRRNQVVSVGRGRGFRPRYSGFREHRRSSASSGGFRRGHTTNAFRNTQNGFRENRGGFRNQGFRSDGRNEGGFGRRRNQEGFRRTRTDNGFRSNQGGLRGNTDDTNNEGFRDSSFGFRQ